MIDIGKYNLLNLQYKEDSEGNVIFSTEVLGVRVKKDTVFLIATLFRSYNPITGAECSASSTDLIYGSGEPDKEDIIGYEVISEQETKDSDGRVNRIIDVLSLKINSDTIIIATLIKSLDYITGAECISASTEVFLDRGTSTTKERPGLIKRLFGRGF